MRRVVLLGLEVDPIKAEGHGTDIASDPYVVVGS
jgi:hypothetical protein